jgi:hypothetical protein
MSNDLHRNQAKQKDQIASGSYAVIKRLLSIPDPPGKMSRTSGETLFCA